jgi:hypothetical protein
LLVRELFSLSSTTARAIRINRSRRTSLWTNRFSARFFSHVIAR